MHNSFSLTLNMEKNSVVFMYEVSFIVHYMSLKTRECSRAHKLNNAQWQKMGYRFWKILMRKCPIKGAQIWYPKQKDVFVTFIFKCLSIAKLKMNKIKIKSFPFLFISCHKIWVRDSRWDSPRLSDQVMQWPLLKARFVSLRKKKIMFSTWGFCFCKTLFKKTFIFKFCQFKMNKIKVKVFSFLFISCHKIWLRDSRWDSLRLSVHVMQWSPPKTRFLSLHKKKIIFSTWGFWFCKTLLKKTWSLLSSIHNWTIFFLFWNFPTTLLYFSPSLKETNLRCSRACALRVHACRSCQQ